MKLTYENNPTEILEKLLEYHDIKTIRGILNKKVRQTKKRGNSYINVAIEVYKLIHKDKYMRERAIDEVAERLGLSDKTVKEHLRKFRRLFDDATYESQRINKNGQITNLIFRLMDEKSFYDDYEMNTFYYEITKRDINSFVTDEMFSNPNLPDPF